MRILPVLGVMMMLLSAAADVSALQATASGGGQAGGGRAGGGGPAGATALGPVPVPMVSMPAGTSALSGVVTNGATGRPLANAIVTLSMQPDGPSSPRRAPQHQTTDSKGRFVFTDLAAASSYLLTGSRFAYFNGGYGATPQTPDSMRIVLADNQWFSRADFSLWPASAISGTVTDEHGEPVAGAYVRVLRQIVVAGTPQYATGPIVTTDDRGVYRISGLDPGVYVVNVPSVQSTVPADTTITPAEPAVDLDATHRLVVGRYPVAAAAGGRLVYPIAFHPSGATLGRAAPVTIDYGAERNGIDVRLEPVPAFSVSGRVEGPSDFLSKLTLRLLPGGAEDLGIGSEAATSLVGADGSFAFLNVPAGDYTLEAKGTMAEYQLNTIGFGRLPTAPAQSLRNASATSVPAAPDGVGLRTITTAGGDAYWARTTVAVANRDVKDIALTLHAAVSLAGRLVFEGAAPHPAGLSITAESADGLPSQGQLRYLPSEDDFPDTFLVNGLTGGDFFIRTQFAAGWVVKSITAGGHDYTRTPFDASAGRNFSDIVITLTDKLTPLSGSVRQASGAAVENAGVILFPADPNGWRHFGLNPDRLQSIAVDTAGTFRFQNVPAGEYLLVAVDRAHLRSWRDPAFLEDAAKSATHATVTLGDAKSVDLTLTVIK